MAIGRNFNLLQYCMSNCFAARSKMQPATNSDVGAVPPGPALVYMPVPTKPVNYDRYKHRQSIGLGITHIVISILCVVFNSVCIAVTEPYRQGNALGFVGHGFWCGIMVGKHTI